MPSTSRPPHVQPRFTRPPTLREWLEGAAAWVIGLSLNGLILYWIYRVVSAALAGFPST